jgi:hypothetical protein
MVRKSQGKPRRRCRKIVQNPRLDLFPNLIRLLGCVGPQMKLVDCAIEKAKDLEIEPSGMNSSDQCLD